MNIITEIIFIFTVYSFIGWVLESAYKSIIQKKFINSGFLAGPFCPIYGYGALIMYYLLNRSKEQYIFTIYIRICSTIIMGIYCWFFPRNCI